MYTPKWFKEDRLSVLHEAIERIGFGTLVTNSSKKGILATHIPMIVDKEHGVKGTIIGHIARGNEQWQDHDQSEALAIFLGPNAYISPVWYESTKETGETVPTWNYIAIHTYGVLRFYDDQKAMLDAVTRLADFFEFSTGEEERWHVSDAPQSYIQDELKGIVGFEMPISRIEGKWKLNQNRSKKDREGVIEALNKDPLTREVAEEMRKGLNKEK